MDYEALGIWLAFWALSSYLLSLKSKSKIIIIGTGFLISTIGFAMLVATVTIIAEQKEKELANNAGFSTYEEYAKAAAAGFKTKAAYDQFIALKERQKKEAFQREQARKKFHEHRRETPIIPKIVGYKKPFRRNSTSLLQHLSLVIYFQKATGIGSPYEIQYQIEDQNGTVYKGSEKYAGASPCKLGYTGVPEILECQRPAFEEIILKSQQQVKPAARRDIVQNGSWWITKGFEYPSFDAAIYSIRGVQVIEKSSGKTLWTFP